MEQKRKKYGGRQKGSANKTTKELKSLVTQFISENWESVQSDFLSKKLHPRDRLNFMERLLKFAVPIMGSTKGSLDIKADLDKLSDDDLNLILEKLIERTNDEE